MQNTYVTQVTDSLNLIALVVHSARTNLLEAIKLQLNANTFLSKRPDQQF